MLDEELCEKKGGKQKECGCEQAENKGHFAIKLVLVGPTKNCDFWWIDRSVSYLSNIALIRVLWKSYDHFTRTMQDRPKLELLCSSAILEPYCGNHVLLCKWKFCGTF